MHEDALEFQEAYLLRFTGLEGILENFYGSEWIHVLPLGAHHEGEEVPQLLHERQVPLLLPTGGKTSNPTLRAQPSQRQVGRQSGLCG